MAGLTTNELHRLNPGYNRWATSPDGPYNLVLPVDKVAHFETMLAQTPANKRLNWLRYKIKSGDNLGQLAINYHTSIDVIRKVNKIKNNNIVVGKYLLIPVAAQDSDLYALSMDQRHANNSNKKRSDYKLTHTVITGDSLWKIAKNYKVKISQLASWNNMAPKTPLQLGQKLVIWSQNNDGNAIMRTISYKVRSGDSLARIANKFDVKLADLIKWNDLNSKKYLQPGQTLKLHIDVTKAS